METIIKLNPDELNQTIFEYLKNIVAKNGIKQITINLNDNEPVKQLRKENKEAVRTRIKNTLEEIKHNKTNFITFTADEFDVYSQSVLKK